ncbi:ferrochelatase [Tessaracoccus bendigoensis DSM 12906]|uniref:coproporphyrin ferrochelatase n=1 Tax=Tessaracoccus bendigoensis DSM 12906 TaxID=1123357 RepID=A0A1M6MYW7_9ACTN|nr:ferrochelatase [Tessaracoccus bendigoensis DSM 12906]
MSLAPFSAVLFASYGGPDRSEDVLPFMRNATAGRGIPDARLLQVSAHYELFGGKSPINELNAQLMDDVRAELLRRGVEVPVVIGNRNWHPMFAETIGALVDAGHERVLAVATSAYQSYSSCRQYCEDLERAVDGHALRIDKLDPFWADRRFAEANARSLVAAVRALRGKVGSGQIRILFVTHSIPLAMDEASSTGAPEARYEAQHLRVAAQTATLAGESLGEELAWELTFCSRSGAPHIPWLEPDINDRLPEVQAEGVVGVVAAPIGFISDHMEVAYDLDTEAKKTAADLGFPYVRAATVGTDRGFVEMLVDRLLGHAAAVREGREAVEVCRYSTGTCCLSRPELRGATR